MVEELLHQANQYQSSLEARNSNNRSNSKKRATISVSEVEAPVFN